MNVHTVCAEAISPQPYALSRSKRKNGEILKAEKLELVTPLNFGTANCKSRFYSSFGALPSLKTFRFSVGANYVYEEIDGGVWALCYAMTMRGVDNEIFVSEEPEVRVNGEDFSFAELSSFCCFLDPLYPLFSGKFSVKEKIEQGLKKNNLPYSAEDIRSLFKIDGERFERPVSGTGNEIFKAMCAIGFASEKEIFCFPWQSRGRFKSFHLHIVQAIDALTELGKIVIIPLGLDFPEQKSEVLNESEMYISDIRSLSESGDFELVVSDGENSVLCYRCGEGAAVGEKPDVLYCTVSSETEKSKQTEAFTEKLSGHYDYFVSARVVDRDNGIVRVGKLFFKLSAPLSLDIENGDFVSFSAARFDC